MKSRHVSHWMLVLLLAMFVCLHPSLLQAQTASQLYSDAVQSYNAGDVAEAKRQLRLTLEIDKNFRPASALLSRIELAERETKGIASGTAALPVPVKTLEKLTFPVEFQGTSLQAALEFIRQQVETVSGGKAQINFVLQVSPELANKKVSLQLSHVPVTEMLRYLGELAGVSFQMQKYAIMVVPAGTSGGDPGPGPSIKP